MDHIEGTASPQSENSTVPSTTYVPPLQLTEGQPPPVASNGGLSYYSFDRDGDAGTSKAIEDALALATEGEGERVIEMLENVPPGPIETEWGIGFRGYEECLNFIRDNNIEAPEGGIAIPLAYTVYERPTYSVVRSNRLWRDPAQADKAKILRRAEENNKRYNLFFPSVMRDARRIEDYHPGISPSSPECMDKLGLAVAHCESKLKNVYDSAEVERVFYPEIEKASAGFLPGGD